MIPALGVYVASCWVVVEILDRLVERYELSPYVTDMVFWGLYSLLPAVALIAWSYGRPGKDTATKAQKVGVPINLLATAALLFVLFGGKETGPAPATEALVETPVEVAAEPESEATQRERLAVFFYENESGDSELDWLQYATTALLTQDLTQDPYLSANSPYGNWRTGYYARLRAAGFENGVGAPASLLRDIARDANRRYFVEGSLRRDGEDLVVATRLWDADSMRRVTEFEQRGWDLYALLDEASSRIRASLDLPSIGSDSYEDLPLAETYGESTAAMEAYIRGLNRRMLDNDIPGAIGELDTAIAEDGSFVMAYMAKASMLLEVGDMAGAGAVLTEAQRLDYRLPATDRAALTSMLFRTTGQSDRLIEFTRLQVELTGEAIWHAQLGELLMVNDEREEAREQFRLALEKDALNTNILLVLSDLERSFDNLDGAIDYARRYQEARPTDMGASIKLGDLLRDTGDLEGAEARYREAALLEDDTVIPLLRSHIIAARLGDDAKARALLEQALTRSETPAQMASVHMMAAQYEARLGRIDAAVDQMRAAEPHFGQAQPPFLVALSIHSAIASHYMLRNDIDAAKAVLIEAQGLVPQPPMNRFLQPIVSVIAAGEGRYDDARVAMADFDALLTELAFNGIKFQVPIGAAYIAHREEDFGEAAAQLEEAMAQIDRSFVAGELYGIMVPLTLAGLADSQVRAGQLESAENTLQRGFALDPELPSMWLAQARLEAARGERDRAQAAVQRTLTTWADADPDLIEYRDALELAGEPLSGGPN